VDNYEFLIGLAETPMSLIWRRRRSSITYGNLFAVISNPLNKKGRFSRTCLSDIVNNQRAYAAAVVVAFLRPFVFFCTLPAFKQDVQTVTFFGTPLTTARTV
jgi:hypothetical protein